MTRNSSTGFHRPSMMDSEPSHSPRTSSSVIKTGVMRPIQSARISATVLACSTMATSPPTCVPAESSA